MDGNKSKLTIAHLKKNPDKLFLESSVITQHGNIQNRMLSWCKVV